MKKLIASLLLSAFAFSASASNIECNKLADESLQVSKNLGQLIIMPKQPMNCRAKLTQVSTEVAASSGLIRIKANKLAKKGLEHSVLTLVTTATLNCLSFEEITKAEVDLLSIANKLPE